MGHSARAPWFGPAFECADWGQSPVGVCPPPNHFPAHAGGFAAIAGNELIPFDSDPN